MFFILILTGKLINAFGLKLIYIIYNINNI